MVASQETLDALEDIGLNMYERKIYAALISRGVSTAGELSEMTNVPRSRAYDVLESLAEKGFAILKPSKPMQYVAVPPEEALENVKDLHREEIEEKLQKIDQFKETEAVQELQQLYNDGVERVEPGEMTGTVKGRYNVYKHAGNAYADAEQEIRIMTTEDGLNDIYENHMDDLEAARENGVNVRVLAPVTDENREAFEAISDVAEIRHLHDEMAERPEARFHIVDEENVVFSLTSDDTHPTQDTAFWSRSEHAASDALGPMFEMAWENAERPE
ncbi:MAG: TrmB family transcriptional regulator [Candidatus Nanohaloarchaea archaeon]